VRWISVATLVAVVGFLVLLLARHELRSEPQSAEYAVLAPGQRLSIYYDDAAAFCANGGVERVASEYDVAATAEAAAKGYAEHRYGDGSYGREYAKAYEGCLQGFGVPPPPPPSEQELRQGNVRVAVPHLQGVRITRKVIGGVHHYFVVADSPRRLLKEGWMTPFFDSLNFRSRGAHPVRVHLYTSRGGLLFSAGRGYNGQAASAAGPLTGAEQVCASQGGNWHPNGFPTFPQPTCNGLELMVWNDKMTSGLASTQLTTANSVCRAAGLFGAQPFGRAFVQDGRLGSLVLQWSCVGIR
jgi:hypothetical protein